MPELRQHHAQSATNPFEEVEPHISKYTASEIATLSRRLEKQLGPEFISSRAGPGGAKVHYLSADKCIGLANEVLGFNGWSSSIQTIQIDFVDEKDQGRVSLGLSVTLRVTLRDGTYHEDIGYGHIENCKGKAAAFEKAKKEGTTDALKRALRNFGNLLGNCIYDKDYVARVTKLKATPIKWDPNNLHRHPNFAPIEKELKGEPARQPLHLPQMKQEAPADIEETVGAVRGFPEDEFGSDDFDAVDFAVSDRDHPDEVEVEVEVEGSKLSDEPSRRPVLPNKESPSMMRSGDPSNVPRFQSSLKMTGPQTPDMRLQCPKQPAPPTEQSKNSTSTTSQPYQSHPSEVSDSPNEPTYQEPLEASKAELPVGFFTARAAESIQAGVNPNIKAPLFNPRLQSPSIRKTTGVDHTKTKPVNRDFTEAAPPLPTATAGLVFRGNSGDSESDRARRIGMPMGAASPLQRRGSYRPPQLKRTGDGRVLKDVTADSINSGDKMDAKRQKMAREIGAEALEGTMKV